PGIQSVSVPFTRGTPPWLIRVSRAVSYFFVSVPFTRGTPPWPHFRVGSAKLFCVSVPFTRGTPPWPRPLATANDTLPSFSPLHEGDTSVAQRARGVAALLMPFQSPSRGGHLRGGTRSLTATVLSAFQSPSRGGHLRGGEIALVAGSSIHVSVPFTRGTPPWHVLLASAGPGDSVSV